MNEACAAGHAAPTRATHVGRGPRYAGAALLFALGQHPATISQLAVALGSHKGNIAHHLKVLREAGLVAVTETRQVRGGTEQYYQRTARRLDFPGEQGTAQAGNMLQAVGEEVATAEGEPLLVLRNIRLTADQARGWPAR